MKTSLRQVLADSYVAAVAIAVLLVWTLDAAFRGLWDPLFGAGAYLATAIAILDIPYFSPTPTPVDRLMLIASCYFFYSAIASFLAACLLSRWVYGVGPFRSLAICRNKLGASKNA